MAKNYPNLYASGNDSISLEQRFYLKEEVTRGTMVYPAATDFFFTMPGGAINFEAPFESSPQRSGRHHSTAIEQKNSTAWNFSTYFNIDTSLGSASSAEIDPALRVLWKSLLGKETATAGAVYDPSETPDLTFSLMEVGDKWARQTVGAFVSSNNVQLPGDGQATCEWAGNSGESYMIGIGQSVTDNNTTNDIVLNSGEAERFEVGGAVMIIKGDNSRSTDTPDGSPRLITAVNTTTDTVTLGGAALADADGSGGAGTEIYLAYYEPDDASLSAINDIQTGLVGSITIANLGTSCFRSLGMNIQNNHELVDYCYGEKNLSGKYFVPGDRLTVETTVSFNLSDEMVEFLHKVKRFEGQDITAIVGDATTRHAQFELPSVIFNYPGFSLPDTGSIPVEFTGTAFETSFGAADEITASFI
jgi:hypothetical protein